MTFSGSHSPSHLPESLGHTGPRTEIRLPGNLHSHAANHFRVGNFNVQAQSELVLVDRHSRRTTSVGVTALATKAGLAQSTIKNHTR